MLNRLSFPAQVQLRNSLASHKFDMSVDQSALWASAAVKNYDLKCAQTLLAALNTCFIVFLHEPWLLCFANMVSKLLLCDRSSTPWPWGAGAKRLRIRLSLMRIRALYGFTWVQIVEKHCPQIENVIPTIQHDSSCPNSSLSFWSQKVENASQATLWHQWPFIVSKSVLWSQVSVRGYCFAHRVRIWSQFWRRSHSGWVRLTEKWSTIKNMVFSLYLEIPMRYAAFDIRFGIYAKFRVI